MKYVIGKAGDRVGMLSQIRRNVATNAANLIFKSFILPVIDNCDTVWNCCGKANSDNVEKLHRRAVQLITAVMRHYNFLHMRQWKIGELSMYTI